MTQAIEQPNEQQTALTDAGARGLAIATRTVPQMSRITPRWLTHLLHWVPLEAGIYRVNKVKDASSVTVDCSERDERVLPETFVDYVEVPIAACPTSRSWRNWPINCSGRRRMGRPVSAA